MSIESIHSPPPEASGSAIGATVPRALRFGRSPVLVTAAARTDHPLRLECLKATPGPATRRAPVERLGTLAWSPEPPSPPASQLLEDIEARLSMAPRDDVASLHGLLWSYQRLVERLLGDEPDDEPCTHPAHRQWLRMREMQRRLRQRLRSEARRPPMR